MDLLMKTDAIISDCGKYRYRLSRKWDGSSVKPCTFIMLNPSTADAEIDDPTIRRCINFAKSWDCGELIVVNLFAFRATSPKDMMAADDPVGPDNMEHVKWAVDYTLNGHEAWPDGRGMIVCAWGANGTFMGQDQTVRGWVEAEQAMPMALAFTKQGQPRHPLYLKSNLQPIPFYR